MNGPALPSACLRRAGWLLARTSVLGLVAAAPAMAGVGGSVVPSLPTPVAVGDTKTATITITNRSTTPNANEEVGVSAIFLTPSCASTDGFTCFAPDPGVLMLATIVGKTGTSCAGTVFTAGPTDPVTGAFELIAPASKPVVLGPSSGVGPRPRQCIILVNFQVVRAPLDSTPPALPLTTETLGRAQLRSALTGDVGVATGGSTTAIAAPDPARTVDLSITVTNGAPMIGPGSGAP